MARLRFLPVLLFLALWRSAFAHGSLESTASLFVRATGIDIQLYMSRASAAALLPQNPSPLTRETFPDFQRALSAVAPALFTITSGESPLEPDAASASLTDEDDICFSLHFPLRTFTTLTLQAAYLPKMPDGHIASLYALNAANDPLAQAQLTSDAPTLEIHLPTTFASPTPPTTTAPGPTTHAIYRVILAFAALLLLLAVLIASRKITRNPTR